MGKLKYGYKMGKWYLVTWLGNMIYLTMHPYFASEPPCKALPSEGLYICDLHEIQV